MTMALRICHIGCGSHATAVHGPSLQKAARTYSEIMLAACCDKNVQAASLFRDRFGFQKHYADAEEMLAAERPDAVSLVVPVEASAELALRIIEKGIPLIMEKPPGRNREELLRLIEAADRYGPPNRVAFNRRYAPLTRLLIDTLDAGTLRTEMQCLTYDMYRVNRTDDDFSTTAIHAIDAVKHLAGSDYADIRFDYQEQRRYGPNVRNVYIDGSFRNGSRVHIRILPVTGVVVERAEVHAGKHTFALEYPMSAKDEAGGTLRHMNNGAIVGEWKGKDCGDGGNWFETFGFYFELVSFFKDLLAGATPSGGFESALQAVEIADCIRTLQPTYSSREGG